VFELTGKRAVITGAASGIGLAMAEIFAAQGASVTLLDIDSARVSEAAITVAAKSRSNVTTLACDVSIEEQVAKTFRQIGEPIDILVNCAGIAHVGNLQTTTPAELDRLYTVNVRGTYLCMREAVASMMAAKSGVILNIASIAATAGLTDRLAYSMSKGAVLSMTLSVAKDYIAHGIRCNCISPARVHTPFVDGFLARNYPGQEAGKLKALAQSQPIGRMGTAEEVATLGLYLCSDAASFITGTDYPIDGGFFNLR